MKIDRRAVKVLESRVVAPPACHCGAGFVARWKPLPANMERIPTAHVNTECGTAHRDFVCTAGHVMRVEVQ